MTASDRGFAYLWMLLMVALMGLGLTAAAELMHTATQRDKERELLSIGRQFRTALERYRAVEVNGQRQWPMSLQDLLIDPRLPGTRRHLRKLFIDPMTGKAEWGEVRVAGRIVGVHSLSNAVPIKQSGFEADDIALEGKPAYSEWVFSLPAASLAEPVAPAASSAARGPAAAASGPALSASAPAAAASLPGQAASATRPGEQR